MNTVVAILTGASELFVINVPVSELGEIICAFVVETGADDKSGVPLIDIKL